MPKVGVGRYSSATQASAARGGRDSGGVIRGSLGSSRRGCSEATCRGTNEAFRRRACKRTQEAEGGKPWD
ncbi:hypothetical protein B296_00054901 [Ensete ventricosum]|uniref:Uncharacterized protein n=1 Tax=Ensete ventricosum TaxID=4639 RepID=A0A426XX81_ENSVE|nr:hypothetical protein B296_00054901 [Ensete ventricosum]